MISLAVLLAQTCIIVSILNLIGPSLPQIRNLVKRRVVGPIFNVMHLILAGTFSRAVLTARLQQRRAQVRAYRTDLERATGDLDKDADWKQHLALEYGSALATAELVWLDNTLHRLVR